MVPVVLCPCKGGSLLVLTEQPGSKRSRTVFLSTQKGEDMCWPTESVYFVIDTGVQKKMVNYFQQNHLKYVPEMSNILMLMGLWFGLCRCTIQE